MPTAAIIVRYWAAARAAAGVASEEIEVTRTASLAEVMCEVRARHPDQRFSEVVGACSVLVGDAPVGTRPHGEVDVAPGAVVEFLPPFAGG